MPQTIRQSVDAVDDVLRDRGAGARIEIQRDTTSAFAAPTSLTNVTLIATQTQYEIYDSAGTAGNWYRTRLATSTGTQPSDWVVFQAGALTAYATLDDVREYLGLPDDSHDNLLSDLLVQASAYLDEKCRRDFYRHPQVSGTEVRLYDVTGRTTGNIVDDIVSLTTVEWAYYTGGAFTALTATDWMLQPQNPRRGWPYEEVALSDLAVGLVSFYRGRRTARLTGVFGFAAVPDMIAKATLDLVREWYRQGPGGGGPVGVNQFGTPIFGGGEPKSVKDAVEAYRRRTWLVA